MVQNWLGKYSLQINKVICSAAIEDTTLNIVKDAVPIIPARGIMFKVFTLIENVFLERFPWHSLLNILLRTNFCRPQTGFNKPWISPGLSMRQAPGANAPKGIEPIATRITRKVGCPT